MISKFTFLISILLAVACSSPQSLPPASIDRPPHFSNKVSGNFIHSADMSNLRYRENIKAYSLGRRVDDLDSSIMHEGGIIYRIENDSAWNLQPGLPPKIPFGDQAPILIKDNEELLRAEIEVKANEQRALYKYLKRAAEKANGQIDALKESASISRNLLEQNKSLKEKLLQSEANNKKLSENLLRLKEQLKALMKFYQNKELEKIKSQFRRKP